MEPIEFIRKTPPFHHLTEAELAQVQAALTLTHFTQTTLILAQGGDPSDTLYLIRTGDVRLLRDGQLTQVLETGESFGYVSMMGSSPPLADVVAGAGTTLYGIPEALFRVLIDNVAYAEFFMKGLSDRLRRSLDQGRTGLGGDLITAVGSLISRDPLFLDPTATVQQAAQIMRDSQVGSLLVKAEPLGIITDRDLRNRVLAQGLGPQTPIRAVMTQPVKTVAADTPIHNAIQILLEANIHHLPLEEAGRIVGVVSGSDLVRHQARSPLYLLQQVDRLDNVAVLGRYAVRWLRAHR